MPGSSLLSVVAKVKVGPITRTKPRGSSFKLQNPASTAIDSVDDHRGRARAYLMLRPLHPDCCTWMMQHVSLPHPLGGQQTANLKISRIQSQFWTARLSFMGDSRFEG